MAADRTNKNWNGGDYRPSRGTRTILRFLRAYGRRNEAWKRGDTAAQQRHERWALAWKRIAMAEVGHAA